MAKQEVLEGVEKTMDVAEDTVHTLERIPKMNLNGTSKSEQKIILFTVAAGGAIVGGFLTFAAIKRRLPFRRNKNTVINPPVL